MPTRVRIEEVARVFDITDQAHFLFDFGTIPGYGSDRDIAIKCQNVQYAGYSNQAYETRMHGHVANFRGIKDYPRTLSATFLEDDNMATSKIFKSWHEHIVGTRSGNSVTYKSGYAITPFLYKFDTTGRIISVSRYINTFIQDVPDLTFDGTASAAVSVSITLKYDWVEDNIINYV